MRKTVLLIVSMVATTLLAAGSALTQTQPAPDDAIDRYIVVLNDDVDNPSQVASGIEQRQDVDVGFVYSSALEGFSAEIPDGRLAEVRADRRVDYVEPDGIVYATEQVLPWGIDRIDADTSSTKAGDGSGSIDNVNAYIIDTGVDASHTDLNVAGHINFRGDGKNYDCDGHGTHVAGTVAAEDNAQDVVGVAPGAPITAVKVLGCEAAGPTSGVIAGVDWVTENAVKPAVANMSLGGGASRALDDAVRNSAASGVFYSIAAMNDGVDACNYSPARAGRTRNADGTWNKDNGIMTVAATNLSEEEASWSNYGPCIDIWAPGVNVRSTKLGGGTVLKSGTSMAAPHVGGGGALYLSSAEGASPVVGEATLKDAAVSPGTKSKDGRTILLENVGAPETTVDSGPSGTSDSNTASFSFSSSKAGSAFDCSLDGAAFSGCTSPRSYADLSEGKHTFEVRATDALGNTDPTPASRTWTVDTTPPETTIDSGPSGPTNNASASFAFSSSEAGATFECSLDGAAFASCTSPKTVPDEGPLAAGPHTFEVKATDPSGNADPTPAKRSFTVDVAAPDTYIASGPDGPTNDGTLTFSFSGSDDLSQAENLLYSYKLDSGEWSAYSTATSVTIGGASGISEGAHTFYVKAKDEAANADNTPAVRSFVVDITNPRVSCGIADGAWHKDDVSIPCTASDDGSGLADPADASFLLTTSVADGTETNNAQTNSKEIVDKAGNSMTAGPVGANKVDKKAPSVTISAPPSDASYLLEQVVKANYSCTDGGSGVTSCAGPVASGDDVDTSSVGPKTFKVEAGDKAGNVASRSYGYTVVYDFGGFFQPVDNLPTLNVMSAGRAVPVKFGVSGYQGLSIFAEGYPKSQKVACDSGALVDGMEETATANGHGLTYDASADRYNYVWKTERAWAGSCQQLVIKLKDGTFHRADFEFK